MSEFEKIGYKANEILVKFCKENGGFSCAESLLQNNKIWHKYPKLVADLVEVFGLYEDLADE